MKKILIKCGGSVLDQLSEEFFESIEELVKKGHQIIFVHGGGPDINQMLETMNVTPIFVNGLRRTDAKTLKVVEMVLSGKTNRKLVEKLTKNRLQAIGVNGSDAGLFQADYVNKEELGFVGEIQAVNKSIIQLLLSKGMIPVITPIAVARDGEKLNVNADYAAAAIANALEVEHCLFVTDVDGIKIRGEIQSEITIEEIHHHIQSGEIYGGMIPKVQSALSALKKGVESVMIVSGKNKFFNNQSWKGTKIIGKEMVIQ
ncbi:acetylglutamate kinase [Cytobacillus sp. Hz8]|uniref:acetylglutamate kinase n=1 Tax=Cytobacillus sp. Hz8 TaxID=3347168 RepID=UPI0035DC67BB